MLKGKSDKLDPCGALFPMEDDSLAAMGTPRKENLSDGRKILSSATARGEKR